MIDGLKEVSVPPYPTIVILIDVFCTSRRSVKEVKKQ